MACLKMPEVNNVLIAGNLTKDPIIRKTSNGIPVVNFYLASNRKYRDANNHWAEDVCYVGVVAWSRLAESCLNKLKKGSAVLVDGELQSRTWHAEDGVARTVVEIKAHRIQFLNKVEHPVEGTDGEEYHDTFDLLQPQDMRMGEEAYASGGFLETAITEDRATIIDGCEPATITLNGDVQLKLKPKTNGQV